MRGVEIEVKVEAEADSAEAVEHVERAEVTGRSSPPQRRDRVLDNTARDGTGAVLPGSRRLRAAASRADWPTGTP